MNTLVNEQTVIGLTLLTGEMLISRLSLDPDTDFMDPEGNLYVDMKNLKRNSSVILRDPLVIHMQPQGQPDQATGRTSMAVGFGPFQPSDSGVPQYVSTDKILSWFFPAKNLEAAYVQMVSGIVIPRPNIPGNRNGKLVGV